MLSFKGYAQLHDRFKNTPSEHSNLPELIHKYSSFLYYVKTL